MTWGDVELEPEVQDWFYGLSYDDRETVTFYVDLLAVRGPLLGEPHGRQLDGKLRELRFHLNELDMRITYWIASGRRIILLTVFRKTRMRETAEVDRARRVLRRCVVEQHTADEDEEWAR
ncbi:type II toxin-antitoxin system RelE/ParE family toxin [Kitasatospora sp. NPDC101155]|uniref:type II toxin-antitoxin system RelE/ParE family toxin n=1 Tax=Kitasatospora sp. NPDC101155 TaxID=3364097 RepID=UPI003813BDF8